MEDLKISKELISEILGCDVIKTEIKDNILEYDCDFDDVVIARNINIYEFAFKCKEWAWGNFKIMLISHYTGQCYINGDLSDLELNYWNKTKSYQVEDNTEVKAIIKACEWVLKETQK
ncbi:hypothetical protein [Aliarcobacter butzleri]|uniref:hypothetical protein n=1 Tax=Aliarcobacter butzleri TaxID=28197 RepID=UPI0012FB1113|nr:hypothetical protein [Aliarcobacter butzleri]